MLNFFLNFKLNMLISVMLIKKQTCIADEPVLTFWGPKGVKISQNGQN